MLRYITILLAGILFGFGLSVSELVNPKKVLDFLDITGTWDPSLLLVMLSAVIVTSVGTFLALKKQAKPLLGDVFHLPTKKEIDVKLVAGSALFGLGWGMVGLCPGPTIAATAYLIPQIFIFLASMLVGMILKIWLFK